MKGLDLPLVDVAGRRTLPANDIVRRYDTEGDGPNRQFDFVLFVDAVEADDRVFLSDAKAFRATHRRLKWDVAQK
jgi:hypothetical protein